MKFLKIITISLIICIVGVSSVILYGKGVQAKNNTFEIDQQIISDLLARLQQRGVPVSGGLILQDVNIGSDSTINVLQLVEHNQTENDFVTADYAIYSNAIDHEVILAFRQGLTVDAYQLVTVNNTGKEIRKEILYLGLYKEYTIDSPFVKDGKFSEAETEKLLKEKDYQPVHMNNVSVWQIDNGLKNFVLDFDVENISLVNDHIENLVREIGKEITKLNAEQGAAIVTYQIRLHYTGGDPILIYVQDLEFGRLRVWCVKELNQDWLSNPRPPTITQEPNTP